LTWRLEKRLANKLRGRSVAVWKKEEAGVVDNKFRMKVKAHRNANTLKRERP